MDGWVDGYIDEMDRKIDRWMRWIDDREMDI